MADEHVPLTTQQLLDEALARFAANKTKMLVDTGPDLVRVQALAVAVQAEQTTRIADTLDAIERVIDSVLSAAGSDGYAVRTRPLS